MWSKRRKIVFAIIVAVLFVLAILPYECLALSRKVQYVDRTSGSDSNDGSSWEEAFRTAAGWSAQDSNLVDEDVYLQVYLRTTDGTDDTTGLVLDTGWTTNVTHTIELIGDPNTYAYGDGNDAAYVLSNGTDADGVTITCPYVTMTGIQVWNKISGDLKYEGISIGTAVTGVSNVTIRDCFVYGWTRNLRAGIRVYGTGGHTGRYVYNNIIVGCENGIRIGEDQIGVYNNTIVKSQSTGISIWRNATLDAVIKNNLIVDSSVTDYYVGSAGGSLTTGYNYTSDATSPDGLVYRSWDPNFIDADANDYHLHADMAGLIDDCENMSSRFTTDIDGTTRTHWDAGADEIVEGEEPPAPPAPTTPTLYYVDPVDGNDANDGLHESTAWKTITYAAYHATSGTKILLMTGNYGYVEIIGSSGMGMDGVGYPGLPYPMLDGYRTVEKDPNNTGDVLIEKMWIQATGRAWFLDFNDVNFVYPDPGGVIPTDILCHFGGGSYFKLRNCLLEGVLDGNGVDPRFLNTYSLGRVLAIGVAGSGSQLSNVFIDHCTIKKGCSTVYFVTDNAGDNIEITHNDISESCNGGIQAFCGTYAYRPVGEAILIHGNYIHSQAEVYTTGQPYITLYKAHGTGVYIDSDNITVDRNHIEAYGNTAAIRTYPNAPPDAPFSFWSFAKITVTGNLITHCLNVWFQMDNLVSGSIVSNNTAIGVHATGEAGIHYFQNAATNCTAMWWGGYYEPMPTHNYSTLKITNNIVLGPMIFYGSGMAHFLEMDCIFKGNMIWSSEDRMTQTALDALKPGNKIYCDDLTEDANAADFETGGTFFAGGTWFDASAFDPAVVVNGIWTAGTVTFGAEHGFDLGAKSGAIGFADANGLPATDFWGYTRVGDSGYAEYYAAPPEPPATTKVKHFIGHR